MLRRFFDREAMLILFGVFGGAAGMDLILSEPDLGTLLMSAIALTCLARIAWLEES